MGSDHEGYDYNFVEPPDEEYICPICLLVLRNPHQTTCCGNHFCECCIDKQLHTLPSACPMCRATTCATMLDRYFLRKVHALKLRCPRESNGCLWVGELGDVEKHLDLATGQCTAMFPCTYNCGKRLLASQLPSHHSQCERRPYRCEHCLDFNGTHTDVIRDHFPVCPKYPVPCPNGCSAKEIQRANLTKHLGRCPFALLECNYKAVGCTAKIRIQDVSSHNARHMSQHLRMAYSAYVRISDESSKDRAELTAVNQTLKQEITRLKGQLTRAESDAASAHQMATEGKRKLEGRESEIESLRAELETTCSQLKDKVKRNDELEQKVQKQAAQLSTEQRTKQSLEGMWSAKEKNYVTQIESLQKDLKTTRLSNDAQKKEVLEYKRRIDSFQRDKCASSQTIEDQKVQISLLKGNLEHKNAEVDELLMSASCTIEDLKTVIDGLQKTIAAKDSRLASMNTTLEGRMREVQALEHSVALREQQLQAIQAKYGLTESDCNIM